MLRLMCHQHLNLKGKVNIKESFVFGVAGAIFKLVAFGAKFTLKFADSTKLHKSESSQTIT